MADPLTPLQEKWTLALMNGSAVDVLYTPTHRGAEFHELTIPNAILVGPRGTGKSVILRHDAHMHALMEPGMAYLIVRRTMPELRRSHLRFIEKDMHRLGGTFNKTESIAYYPNGSLGYYGHAETDADIMIYLSSEFARVYFDEITTFPGSMILKLASCIRVPEGSGQLAALRGGTNPLGESADWVMRWFITKQVPAEESDEYRPSEYGSVSMVPDDNPHMDWGQYRRRLANLPEHVRKAWLLGEWVIEGVYFSDFKPQRDGKPWHVIDEAPLFRNVHLDADHAPAGIAIYRVLDYGFDPDPAVCLWIGVFPNGRAVVFKERTWWRTTAVEVGKAVARESAGMRVTETLADPTLFDNQRATGSSVADLIEQQGVSLTPSVNDRIAAGYAIHEYLNQMIEGAPKLQLLRHGCPHLIRTLPEIRQHKHHPEKIADGNDHYVMALSYFCLGMTAPSLEVSERTRKPWERAYYGAYRRIGAENVREH